MDGCENGPELVYRSSDGSVFEYEYYDGWGIITESRTWFDLDDHGEEEWLGWWFEMFFWYGAGPSLWRGELRDSIYLPRDLSGVLGPYDTEAEALAAGVAFHRQVASDHSLWIRYLGEVAANMRRWP